MTVKSVDVALGSHFDAQPTESFIPCVAIGRIKVGSDNSVFSDDFNFDPFFCQPFGADQSGLATAITDYQRASGICAALLQQFYRRCYRHCAGAGKIAPVVESTGGDYDHICVQCVQVIPLNG